MPVLPKRKISDIVTQTVEETQAPHKKLRIAVKRSTSNAEPSIQSLASNLEVATSSNDALQILMQMSDDLIYNGNGDDITEIVRKLGEHFKREKESAVRVKVLSLLADLAIDSCVDGTFLVDEIVLLLKTETSPKVISQGLQSLHIIGDCQNLPSAILTRIVLFAKQQLSNASHNVQRHALLLLGAFLNLREAEKESLDLISKYTDSQDSRVRAQAFRAILMLGKRDAILPPNLYFRAVDSLKDDYECVRKEALQLVFESGVKNSEFLIDVPDSDSKLRLIDAAFSKICSAMCDLSMQVRVQAAGLLGGMTKVGNEFLHQTLDKKLMSNLRRKKSLHERYTELFQSGEWSSGKKWADDAPKEQVNVATVSLIATGACGALVHGLEDEFLEVRTAAVESMCRLAMVNPPFAVMSLDFLVDMFNDEIEEVRLKAISSLTSISRHITLREDQLETMLSSLEDFSVDVREELHIMFGACKVSTQNCLLMVVQKVLDVLAKYPQDKLSAFGCMQRIGEKHPEICLSLVTQLLQDHPFLDSAERDVEDPSYACILILIFNAAKSMPPILSLLLDITVKHYSYLRDTMPNLVPPLPIGGIQNELTLAEGSTGSRQFLETLLNNIRASYSAPRARQALLTAAQQNLDRLADIDPELSGTAIYTGNYLGAQLLIEQLQSGLSDSKNRSPPKECINQLMIKCLKLQHLFSSLSLADHLMVKEISLRASALQLVLIVKDRSQSALAPCQLLLKIANEICMFLQDNPSMKADAFTSAILGQISNMNDPKPGRVFREILPIVQTAPPIASPEININIKICTGKIIEPTSSMCSDNIIKVTAGLIASLTFVAELNNLQETKRKDLRIRIKYPDQNVQFVVPRMRDLKRITNENENENNNWRLRTTLLLSHGVWTEASQIDVSLCLSVRPGHELELCKPIKVLFSPKPVKRGI